MRITRLYTHDTASRFETYVLTRLPLTRPATLPEIALHLAQPSSGVSRFLATSQPDARTPYWACLWSGGAVLARYILDHPEVAAGRRVLDLGAGSGVVAIAAALAGAAETTAADIDPNALRAVGLNAAANGVAVARILSDVTDAPVPDVDVVFVGDLFYERALAESVTAHLDRCRAAGVTVIVGDPRRAHLPRERLSVLAEALAPDFGRGVHAATTPAAVFAYVGGIDHDAIGFPASAMVINAPPAPVAPPPIEQRSGAPLTGDP